MCFVGSRISPYELSQLLVKRLGVTDVGVHYPHRVKENVTE
jgi:hypothetical protein